MSNRQDGFILIFIIALVALLIVFMTGYVVWHKSYTKCPKTTCGSVSKAIKNTPTANSEAPSTPVEYLSTGDVPTTGVRVGVTFYGALEEPENGKYIVSNLLQGGQKNGGKYDGFDDNGEGACGGKYANLADQSTWAEDKMGMALGNLPCGTKLALSYQGHTVIAERGDRSNGGCANDQTTCYDNGVERKVDLWWQTAKALCLSDQPSVITVHVVPQSTPTTIIEPYSTSSVSSYSICR